MGVSIRSILVGCYQQKRNVDKGTPVIVARPRDFYTFFLFFAHMYFQICRRQKFSKLSLTKTQVHPPRFHSQFNDDNTIDVHVLFVYVDK